MKTREQLQKAMDEITKKHIDSIAESKKSHDDYTRTIAYIGPFSDLTEYHQEWLEENLEGEQLSAINQYFEARSKFGFVISEAINWICDKVAPKTDLEKFLEQNGLA